MKKHVLKIDNVSDSYSIIGISSHENDYRLSWAINTEMSVTFGKTNDYILFDKKNNLNKSFSLYMFDDEDQYIKLLLISNKSELGFLIPELNNIDFFIVFLGELDDYYINNFLGKLKTVSIISMALKVDQNKLKSKKNLDFSLYE